MYSLIHNQKRLSYLVAIVFMLTLVFTPGDSAWANPAKLKDIQGHWGQATIEAMAEAGIVSGNPDGTYDPEGKISRSQFATLIVKAYNLKGSGKIFTDTASHWAKDYIAIANANGIVSGYSDSRFGPDDPITREQMAVMIVKAARLDPSVAAVNFTDQAKISAWALSAAATAYAHNIIKGMPDGRFAPQDFATRAQAAVVVYAGLKTQSPPPAPAENYNLFDKAGKYGPTSGTITVNGNVTVKAPGVTLQNLVIKGDLIIAQEVGDGDVTLNNIKVEGKTYVRGGGSDSIHIKGGQYSEIIVEKTAGGQVRIVLVDTQGVKVTLAENAKGEEIILQGEIKTVTVKADHVKITTQGATTITEFRVASGLTGINIDLGKDSTVKEMLLDSKVTVTGEGKIKEASGSKAKESSFARQPDKITAPSGGGGGGGGSSTPGTNYSSIDKAGTYGPASGTETVNGSVTVKAKGVTLQNLIIKGDLIIAQEVGDGNVTLNNIQVTGKTYVRGGGKDSIHINGGQYSEVIVENTATGGVRIVVVNNQGIQITLAESATNEQIILSGSIGTVTVRAEGVNITTQADSQICQLNIPSGLNNVNINLAAGSIVNEMVLDSKATVTGNGTINEASGSKTEESSFSQDPEKVIYNADFSAVNSFGIHADKVYAGYELKDKDNKRIDLIANNIKTLTVLEPGSAQGKDLTVGDDNDPLLWFNVEKAAGDYKYTVETNAEKTYAATLKWSAPKTATWQATGGEGPHEGKTYVEYKLMDGENPVSLKAGAVKLIASKKEGQWVALEANTDETLWFNKAKATGNYDFIVITKDNIIYRAALDWTAPVVLDSTIEKDAGTGGAGATATVEGKNITFSGSIDWYPADESLGRIAGNRVGVKITAPTDVTPGEATTLTFNQTTGGDKTITGWDNFKDGDNFFYFYPLVKEAGQTTTLVIKWDGTDATADTFTIKISEGTTLMVAPAEPKVISGMSVAARTASTNGDKIEVATVTGSDKAYTVTVSGTGVLESVTSPSQGVGLWFGLQLSPEGVTDITKLEYKTAIQTDFTALTEADAAEAGADGQIVWWINGDAAKTQDIYLKYAGEAETTAIKLTISFVPYTQTIAACVDYNAVWNETRGTWYIKVSVPEESLDHESVTSINVIKEAGVALTEPRALTPDTDKVLWFGVAKGDGDTSLKNAGEYAYEVIRKDGTKYIFNFTYAQGSVTGATNLVQEALKAVNEATSADNYAGVKTALETNAVKLGLNLTEYEKLINERKPSVANDIYNNKGNGYTIETLKPMFDEIVATRLVFQNSVALFAAASESDPLKDLTYITMLIENLEAVKLQTIHSGKNIADIRTELNGLVTDFGNLTTDQKTAVLAAIDYTKNSSSTATRNALRAAITKVKAEEEAAVQAALKAVNEATSADNYAGVKTALETNAVKLGLNLTDYNQLDPEGRKNAVANDILNNKGDGYTIETLKPMFDEIVATRLVFQNSVALFAAASESDPLKDLTYITMLIENLEAVKLQTIHSGKNIADIRTELNGLVTDFGNLTTDQKTAVLAAIDYTKSSSSTATRNALRAAITKVEADQAAIDARLAITSVSIADNKAYASTKGTVRVLGYGIGINLDAKNEGKKISDTTSIVVELYNGENLLGQQTFNQAGYDKHGGASTTSGTIDAGGQYKATSWDNSWSAGIAHIPNKAVAKVQYTDGIATAELTLNFTEDQTKIFFAAEAVHALFENVFAETLVLAADVTEDAITAAETKVNAVTVKPEQNKAALQGLITQARNLLKTDEGTEQEANIEMMQIALEDPVVEEPLEIEPEAEATAEETIERVGE